MNEQEITTLLDEMRCDRPQSSLDAPTLDTMTHGYNHWANSMSLIVAGIALGLIIATTAVVVPSPRYGYVQGALAATPNQACQSTYNILSLI